MPKKNCFTFRIRILYLLGFCPINVQGTQSSWNSNILKWASGFIGGKDQSKKEESSSLVNIIPFPSHSSHTVKLNINGHSSMLMVIQILLPHTLTLYHKICISIFFHNLL